MFLAFLSSRLRTWVLFALVLPLVGRLLEAVGARVSGRSPQVGQALSKAGSFARSPAPRGRRRRW
jgi:hypothetical protein